MGKATTTTLKLSDEHAQGSYVWIVYFFMDKYKHLYMNTILNICLIITHLFLNTDLKYLSNYCKVRFMCRCAIIRQILTGYTFNSCTFQDLAM